jgi:cell division protein FtsB
MKADFRTIFTKLIQIPNSTKSGGIKTFSLENLLIVLKSLFEFTSMYLKKIILDLRVHSNFVNSKNSVPCNVF